jgi:hypothetical protein
MVINPWYSYKSRAFSPHSLGLPPLPPQHCLSVGSKPQGQDKPGLNLKLGLVAGWIKVARDNVIWKVD